MSKFNNGLVASYRFMLLLFGVLEIALLWTMSMFFICYISSDVNEVTFFCKDHIFINILFIGIAIVILFLLKKKGLIQLLMDKLDDDSFYKKVKTYMLRIIAVMGFVWVIITQYVPGSDQLDVLSSAYKYGVRDATVVEAGGYLDKWLHNVGIATVERVLALFVGDFNVVFMQLLNVLGIVFIYKKIVDTWEKQGGSRFSQICTLAAGIVFYPFIMYASFVYGNIWSVTLSLFAFDAELDYFDSKKKVYLLKFAIAVGLSYMVKGSAILFIVALGIYAIIRGAVDKTKLYHILVVILVMLLSYGICSVGPKAVLSNKLDRELRDSDGIWAFIAMGLQEEGATAGWYNGYCLNVYYDNNRDTVASEKEAKDEVINRLNYLFGDKHNAYEFFSKKIASTWIEPTYQGYWINQVRAHRVIFNDWLEAFMSAKGYNVAAKLFNYLQILVFLGTVLWLILEDKVQLVNKSFLLLSFIGGFTFFLFWETKAQYAVTYYVLLFPYAASGYELLLEKANTVTKESNKLVFAYVLATFVIFSVAYVRDGSNCLSNHNDAYSIYLDSFNPTPMVESVNEINSLRADLGASNEREAYYIEQLEKAQEREAYYKKLLEENNIEY